MNSSMTVTIVREAEAFRSLRSEWNALLTNSESDTIFLRWEWLYTWWEVYGEENKLFIVTVRKDANLIGVAPLFVTNHALFFRKFKFLGANLVCSDYLDFILLKNQEEAILQEIIHCIIGHHEEWDLLELTDLPAASRQLPLLSALLPDHRRTCQTSYTLCPYIDLSTTWDSIFSSFSPLLQNSIKRKIKKLGQSPEPHFVQLKDLEDCRHHFNNFLRINQLRLTGKKIRSPFLDQHFLAFHRKILTKLCPLGMATLSFLKIGQQYIAGLYQLVYNQRHYYYQSGFDPDWQQLSPGTLLLHFCIKEAHTQKMKEFDFLQGDEDYKKNWTPKQRINCKITIYNRSLRGFLAPLAQPKILLPLPRGHRRPAQ